MLSHIDNIRTYTNVCTHGSTYVDLTGAFCKVKAVKPEITQLSRYQVSPFRFASEGGNNVLLHEISYYNT